MKDSSNGPDVTLYSMVICPFAQRTRIHLALKGVDFELINLDICSPRPDWFVALNPQGQVPTLVAGDDIVSDSNIVAEYIEDQFTGPDLYHGGPAQRARVRTLMKYLDTTFVPTLYLLMGAATAEERQARIAQAHDTFLWVNNWLDKAWSSGYPPDGFGLPEIVAAPFLLRYQVVAYYQDFDVTASPDTPQFNTWQNRLLQSSLVTNTAESMEDLIKMYEDYTIGYYNGAVPPGRKSSSSDLSAPLADRPMPLKATSVR